MKRYSEMNLLELYQSMDHLLKEKEQALQEGLPSKADMLERKYYMAKAYTMKTSDFAPGTYKVVGREEPFHLRYLNGVMAWGDIGNETEVSFPISMLKKG